MNQNKGSKRASFILTILCVMALCASFMFTACGSADRYQSPADRPSKPQFSEGMNDSSDPFGDGSESSDHKNEPVPDVLHDRVIIKNAELSVQTLEYDKFMTSLNERIALLGGYISDSRQNGNPLNNPDDLRFASLTVRIPAEKLDEFLDAVGTLGNITNRSESAQDITAAYIDTEAKLEALRAEYDALIAMLEKAEAVADIIVIQDRLNEVRYEIESQERIMRSYDDLVAFSTVNMSVCEVRRESPAADETFWQEISRRFSDSLADVGHGFTRVSAWVLGNLPEIIVWLVLIAVIILIIVLCVKHSRRRKAQQNGSGNTDNAGNRKAGRKSGKKSGRKSGRKTAEKALPEGTAENASSDTDASKAPEK